MSAAYERSLETAGDYRKNSNWLRNSAALLVGIMATSMVVTGAYKGLEKVMKIDRQYQEKVKENAPILSDEDLVRAKIRDSKYPDPKTGMGQKVYRLTGAIAMQAKQYGNPTDGLQHATITNLILMRLPDGVAYAYGENAASEPQLMKLDQNTALCSPKGVQVMLEEVTLGHDLQGGIGHQDTGTYLANDQNWQEKCQIPVDLSRFNILETK